MRTIKLTLAYDGSNYAGWQVQPDRITVQQTLEAAIAAVTGETVRAMSSGRTDTGVHALGQVASFRTASRLSVAALVPALNANLPQDVAILQAEEVHAAFHATLDTVRKRYRYLIDTGAVRDVFRRRYAWHLPCELDVDAMHRAAQALVGEHDFASFQTSGSERKSTVRTVYSLDVSRGAGEGARTVTVEIEANGFLYNMVRSIVGTLVAVGRKQRPETWVAEALARRDRRAAGRTAPPQGLFLVHAIYAPATGQGRGGGAAPEGGAAQQAPS